MTFMGDQNSWPRIMERILNRKTAHREYRVINKGVPSITTEGILSELDTNLERFRPDVVVAMMGINDTIDTPVYVENFKTSLRLALTNLRIWKMARLIAVYAHYYGVQTRISLVDRRLPWLKPQTPYETFLLDEIKYHPFQSWSYKELTEYYEILRDWPQAERVAWTAVISFPKKSVGFELLARVYTRQKKSPRADVIVERALASNPSKAWSYQLGALVRTKRQDWPAAESFLRQAIERAPSHEQGGYYLELAKLHLQTGDNQKALAVFREAADIHPADTALRMEWSELEESLNGRRAGQEILFEHAEQSTDNIEKILQWYLIRGEIKKARNFLWNARRRYSKRKNLSKRLYTLSRVIKRNPGKFLESVASGKPDPLNGGYFPATAVNYRQLADALAERDIKLVSVQYPMRSAAPLREILQDRPVFAVVDNESVFKKVVKPENFHEYFIDRFGGDFGHCTLKGNRLLAQNIARVIWEKIP